LRGQTWETSQFVELANDLIGHGVHHDPIPEPISRAGLKARYPKVVSWPEGHPIAFGLLLSLAIVVLLMAVLIVVVLSSPA
jgi:hypothetical protein